MSGNRDVFVAQSDAIAAYGFGEGHPFGLDRHDVFHFELQRSGVAATVELGSADPADNTELQSFHSSDYIREVQEKCAIGEGFLDQGDTPALTGIDIAAAAVVGASVAAMERVMAGQNRRAFVPIAGLHHAGRDHAAGFCVYNDCGVVIELLRSRHQVRRIAYVDIDAHHGDGVFYAFEDDADLWFADIHEDGRFLYPGTGSAVETGRGDAEGTKLNLPLEPGAGDEEFFSVWDGLEAFVETAQPEFILLHCGADSLLGDPIAHLRFSPAAHAHAATRLCQLADRLGHGRVLGVGGGGYNRDNLARAWTGVVRSFVETASRV